MFSGQYVTNKKLQGSELGPQLATTYIKKLDEGTEHNLAKFVDAAEVGGKVNHEKDVGKWQTFGK